MSEKFSKCMTRVLAAALLLSFSAGLAPVLPVPELMSASLTVNAENDGEITCSFDDTTGALTIEAGTYNNPYFDDLNKDDVKSVKANENVVFTGDCADLFSYFENVESIDLSAVDTSNVTDMNYMFAYCKSLKSVNLSSLNTSNVTNMHDMFCDCSSLTDVNLTSFDTSNVSEMYGMFRDCKSLKKLDLSSFKIADGTYVSQMFDGAALEEITISDNMAITEEMQLCNMFVSIGDITADGSDITCTEVIGWKKSGSDDSIVSGIGDNAVFSGAGTYKAKLDNIVWSYDFDNGRVVTLKSGYYSSPVLIAIHSATEKYCEDHNVDPVYTNDYASTYKFEVNDGVKFKGNCSNIFYFGGYYTDYYVEYHGDIDTSEVTNMNNMFSRRVEGLDPKCLNTSSATDMSGMFAGFQTEDPDFELDLTSFNTTKVTNMSEMFSGCAVKKIDISSFDTSNVTKMNNMFSDSEISTIDISHFTIPVSSYDDYCYMFMGCENLTSVKLPSDWKPTGLNSFFSGCTSLKSFDFNSFDSSELTDVTSMFSRCRALETVTIPQMNEITSINSMFEGCTSLKSVDLSNINVQGITYFSELFKDCSSLETVTLPEITKSDISLSSMFSGCSSLKNVNIENIKSQNVKYMDSMFSGCSSIKNIDLSNLVSVYDYFSMSQAFKDCSSLETVKLPAFKKIMNSNNSSYFKELFSGAEKLQSITVNSNSNQSDNSVITESVKLENANYFYGGWHMENNSTILSGSGEYAVFPAHKGYTYVRDKCSYDKVAIRGATLTLEGQIGINFYLEFPSDIDENAYVIMSGPKGEQKIFIKDAVLNKKEGYKFTYRVAAKQIHDKVSISVYDSQGTIQTLYSKTSDGNYELIDNNKCSYAVSDYISTVQKGTGYSSYLVDLVNALEAYGCYAQINFDYKADSIDVESLAAKDAVASVTKDNVFTSKCTVPDDMPDDLYFKGFTLVLDSETSLRLYFECANIDKYFNSERNLGTNNKLVNVSGNRYYFEISNIPAKELDSRTYLSFPTGKYEEYDYGDGNVYKYEKIANLNVSPLSYVYSALSQYGNNAEKVNLCNTVKALYVYYNAAQQYYYNS